MREHFLASGLFHLGDITDDGEGWTNSLNMIDPHSVLRGHAASMTPGALPDPEIWSGRG